MKGSYESVKQFEKDVKWFAHNCRTVFPQEQGIQIASTRLIGYIKEHIEFINACAQCFLISYQYASNSFVVQCKKLHLLVWARITGYSPWPAKVLAVDAQKGQAVVQFFGDYTWCILPARNCLLFSKNSPEKKRGSHTKKFIKAMEVG